MTGKTILKRLFCPLLAVFILFTSASPAMAADFPKSWPAAPEIEEETGILMESTTGRILFDKGMDEIRYPASTTKVMTALLVLEHYQDLNQKITFTDVITPDLAPGNSSINAKVGEELTVEQCLYAIMLPSANEVCTQMAVNIAGSVAGFTNKMNQRAAQLGCQNTHFANANGLPDPNHYTTAHDLALILAEAVKNEDFCRIAGTALYTIPATNKTPYPRNLENHNALLGDGEFHYENAIAGKTGYTDAAKNTLVTAAKRDDMTLICVVMRSDNSNDRFTDTIKLFDYGFDNFHKVPVYWLSTEEPEGYTILPKEIDSGNLTVTDQDTDSTRTRIFSYQGIEMFRTSAQLPVQAETRTTADMSMIQTGTFQVTILSPLVFPVMMVILAGLIIAVIVLIVKYFQGKGKKKGKKKSAASRS